MADAVDMAGEIEAEHIARGVARAVKPIPDGVSGECDGCGEIMPRLVKGQCGFCRDGRLPPPGWTPPAISTAIKKEAEPMPAKSIQLPASAVRAIEGVEEHAKRLDVSIGLAAASLIERALTLPAQVSSTPTIATIMADLNTVFGDLAARADRPDQAAEVAELTTRAETAEHRLAALRSALEA